MDQHKETSLFEKKCVSCIRYVPPIISLPGLPLKKDSDLVSV